MSENFHHLMRVKVISAPLEGKLGTVVRLRIKDSAAWVRMDEPIPDELRSFPADDQRSNNVLLYPEDCERP